MYLGKAGADVHKGQKFLLKLSAAYWYTRKVAKSMRMDVFIVEEKNNPS